MPEYLKDKIIINSASRETGDSSNFVIQINGSPAQGEIVEMKLLSAHIPNSIYNIRAGINDKIDFSEAGPTLTATLTPGSYSLSGSNSILAELKTQLEAVGGLTYTCTYSSTTLKITIAASGAFTLLFGSGPSIATSAGLTIGFNTVDTVSSASHVANNIPRLSEPFNLYIQISDAPNRLATSDHTGGAFVIPVSVDSGQIVQYYCNDRFYQTVSAKSSSKYSIRIMNGTQQVDLNGAEWSMTIGMGVSSGRSY